jgi:hypothetical protein
MAPPVVVRLLCAAALLASLAVAVDFNVPYAGDGTYYGSGGWAGGNCVLRDPVPAIYAGRTPLAMNAAQYAGACGACVVVRGSGQGSGGSPITGEIQGYVADKCPECAFGCVDLAADGDGRWKITFEFVPCPTAGGGVSYKFEGSNNNYIKVQPRGMATPPSKVTVGGVSARSTDDNFWVADNGAGFGDTVLIQTWTVGGAYYEDKVTGKSGVVNGSGGGGSSAGSSALKSVAESVGGVVAGGGGQCTPDYQRCAGQEGMPAVAYVGCCGGDGWECVAHADIGWGKQCRPKGY